MVLHQLALLAMDRGEPESAIAHADEAVALSAQVQDSHGVIAGRLYLATAMVHAARPAEAHELMCSLIDDIVQTGDVDLAAEALDDLTQAAAGLDFDLQTAHLSGAADRLREQRQLPRPPPEVRHLERSLGPARHRVGGAAWDAGYSAGRRLSHVEALNLARQPLDS